MATFSQRNPVISATTASTYATFLTLSTSPIINLVGDRFILQVDNNIPYGTTVPMVLDDSSDTYAIYDRYGNYVRTDRLYSAIQFRQMGLLPFNGCNIRQFQCVLGADPGRINILCCLPRTNYSSTTDTTTLSVSDTNNVTTTTLATA